MSDLRDTELRGNIPRRLMELIDAVAHAKGFQSRPDVAWSVLREAS